MSFGPGCIIKNVRSLRNRVDRILDVVTLVDSTDYTGNGNVPPPHSSESPRHLILSNVHQPLRVAEFRWWDNHNFAEPAPGQNLVRANIILCDFVRTLT